MTSTKETIVDPGDLRTAYEFVSTSGPFEATAYISLDTGQIYLVSDLTEELEELPDDLETSNRYIAVPDRRDLNLGQRLIFSFIGEELPDDYEAVAGFFRRKGAYRRHKELLASRGVLEKWYDYENRATDEALRDWCEENGIQLAAQRSAAPP